MASGRDAVEGQYVKTASFRVLKPVGEASLGVKTCQSTPRSPGWVV